MFSLASPSVQGRSPSNTTANQRRITPAPRAPIPFYEPLRVLSTRVHPHARALFQQHQATKAPATSAMASTNHETVYVSCFQDMAHLTDSPQEFSMDTRVRTVRIFVPSSWTLTSATRNSTDAGGDSVLPEKAVVCRKGNNVIVVVLSFLCWLDEKCHTAFFFFFFFLSRKQFEPFVLGAGFVRCGAVAQARTRPAANINQGSKPVVA